MLEFENPIPEQQVQFDGAANIAGTSEIKGAGKSLTEQQHRAATRFEGSSNSSLTEQRSKFDRAANFLKLKFDRAAHNTGYEFIRAAA